MGDINNTVLEYPAAILTRAVGVQMDIVSLLDIARTRAFDPAALDTEEPFFFPAEISSDRLDAYFTKMQPSSLKNYAIEADAGVSFMLAHQTRSTMPVGSSLTGKFTGAQGNGVAHVRAEFFTVPGVPGPIISTDQLIRGIRIGMYRDVSIGFWGGRAICSICNQDMYDWRDGCWRHIPGFEYDNVDTKGNVLSRDLCVALIEDAHLAEVSGVYDGATPGAAILKAQMMAEAGKLIPAIARMIEQRYRHLDRSLMRPIHDATLRRFAGHTENSEELPVSENNENRETHPGTSESGTTGGNAETGGTAETRVEERQTPPPAAPPAAQDPPPAPAVEPPAPPQASGPVELTVESVETHSPILRTLLTQAGVPERGDTLTQVRTLVDLARDGRTYREDLVQEAIREGVRAQPVGGTFDEARYREVLERSSIETIKVMRDDWARSAKTNFPGGRQSRDDAGESETKPVSITPDAVFTA